MERITIGNSYLDYCEDEQDKEAVELRTISVHPEEQNTGKKLIDELKKIAGGKRITTYTSADPEKDEFGKFLVSQGFKKTTGESNYGSCWELTNYVSKKSSRVEKQRKGVVGKLLGNKKSSAQAVRLKTIRRKKNK